MKLIKAVLFIFICLSATFAQADFADAAAESVLLSAGLPDGALRVRKQNVPAEISQMLAKIASGSDKLTQGESEVLAWTGSEFRPAEAPKIRARFESDLKNSGWNYELGGQEGGITFFTAIKMTPARKNIAGFWVLTDEILMLAVTEIFVGRSSSHSQNVTGNSVPAHSNKTDSSLPAQTFDLPASADYINVSGSAMAELPLFPSLPVKPNRLRGYVKDLSGKAIAGAYIGVRSSAIGGRYSGASAETDAKGYYEMEVPFGAAHFYAAGLTIDYGEGRAAVALHPADGRAGSFVSADGAVENFVLLPYGIADRDLMSERPFDSASYYGGSVRIEYEISSGDMWASKGSLPDGAQIEITLTPVGEMLDAASGGKSYIVRRKAASGGINNFNINNIPVGRYQITARLAGGKPLKMRKTGYDSAPLFGLNPAEATGTATILFTPRGVKALSAQPNRGNWNAANVKVEIP